jgi:hypothetical protein
MHELAIVCMAPEDDALNENKDQYRRESVFRLEGVWSRRQRLCKENKMITNQEFALFGLANIWPNLATREKVPERPDRSQPKRPVV